jgi:hypothetical protein
MRSLPFPASYAWLKSFWLAMSLASGLLIGSLVSLFTASFWFPLVVVAALVLAIPGLLRPQIAARPYRAWNKLGRILAHHAQQWILLLCFYLVFIAVGRVGSLLKLSHTRDTKSQWLSRENHISAMYGGSNGITIEQSPHRHWISSFLRWATDTNNCWACCLLPFLLLCAAFDSEQEEDTVPDSIYTLF